MNTSLSMVAKCGISRKSHAQNVILQILSFEKMIDEICTADGDSSQNVQFLIMEF
jgi:hypothetical protein